MTPVSAEGIPGIGFVSYGERVCVGCCWCPWDPGVRDVHGVSL